MVRSAAYADNHERLEQHAYTERVHGKTRGIDVHAQYRDYALALVGRAHAWFRAVTTWRCSIGKEDAVFTRQTLEQDRNERC